MKNKRVLNALIAIIGMIILIILAYGIDGWREYARDYYSETGQYLLEIYCTYVIGNLILSAFIVIWSWYVIVKLKLKKWMYLIFIIPGLFITIIPILYFTPYVPLYYAYRLSPAFQVYLTSGIIVMIGVLKLFIHEKFEE